MAGILSDAGRALISGIRDSSSGIRADIRLAAEAAASDTASFGRTATSDTVAGLDTGMTALTSDVSQIPSTLQGEKDAIDAISSLKQSERGMLQADKIASRSRIQQAWDVARKNPIKILATAAAAAIAGAFMDGTDGVQVNITNIKRLDNETIQVSYDKPSVVFHPVPGDSFRIDTSVPTVPDLLGSDLSVSTVVNDNTIVLNASIDSVSTSVSSWGKMTCKSTFVGQIGGTIAEATKYVVDNVVNPALQAAICTTVPFLCNKNILIGSAIACCICLLIIIILSRK